MRMHSQNKPPMRENSEVDICMPCGCKCTLLSVEESLQPSSSRLIQHSSSNTLSSDETHFGRDFASKAYKLQQGAAHPHHLMLERKKKAAEDIWRIIEMQFCV